MITDARKSGTKVHPVTSTDKLFDVGVHVTTPTPAMCFVEAEWMLLGVWLLGLLTIEQLIEVGTDLLQLSVAKARDAVRCCLRNHQPHRRRQSSFKLALQAAKKDCYHRTQSKTAKNYPRKKRETPPQPPKIKPANKKQIQRAQNLPPPKLPNHWTAATCHVV